MSETLECSSKSVICNLWGKKKKELSTKLGFKSLETTSGSFLHISDLINISSLQMMT